MKKEMSSFDVRAVVNEMAALEGAHMDKIFHWGAGNVLFRVNVQGQGKKELFFKDKKWLYLPKDKPDTPQAPTSFASFLRKYVDNALVGKTYQVGFDRVIIMELKKAEGVYSLIFEIFGGGNVLLVLDGKIMNCLIHKVRKDRVFRPGEDYVVPTPRFDPTSPTFEKFIEMMHGKSTDIVRALATDANLGGQYAEEICHRSGIDKNTKLQDITNENLLKMFDCMNSLVNSALSSSEYIMYKDGEDIVDITPTQMEIYSGREQNVFGTASEAMTALVLSIHDKEDVPVDQETEKLQRRVDRQKETIEEYRMESTDLKARADSIYANYEKVSELLDVLSTQSKKITWEKLKEGAMKIPFVTEINPSKGYVMVKLDELVVRIDYNTGIDANASRIYQESKDINEKATRATLALKESEEQLQRKLKGISKARALAATRAQPTKQFWFERYKWFITSGGNLVLSGRDAHSNDQVVKKHLKETDTYAHADVHGAPSVVIKNGVKATEAEQAEACLFALTHSRAWTSCLSEGSAFWVYPDQVSKTPQAGEFVPRGAFIIRGKRNYENHLPMEMGVGEITYENTRKIMCAPLNVISAVSVKYVTIKPSRGKGSRKSSEMSKMFEVPEEEISRILPPGDVEITAKVWPQE